MQETQPYIPLFPSKRTLTSVLLGAILSRWFVFSLKIKVDMKQLVTN